ncbi:hypothetical protein C4D60_Mb10t24370 [Musa balbisiana]|uniref:Uncharacterized protein n=1 Tax=Musa balbisiana TaxID=52838 RepID=A0A4S8J0C6_MUSBA|nr:hypothetical protein C4D60_Mb10t24370 [Musa balbisiana]
MAASKSARMARAVSASLEYAERAWSRTAAVDTKENTGSISGNSSETASQRSKIRNIFSVERLHFATDSGNRRNCTAALLEMSAKTASRMESELAKTWSERTRSPENRVLTATREVPSQDRIFGSSTCQSSLWIWDGLSRSNPRR